MWADIFLWILALLAIFVVASIFYHFQSEPEIEKVIVIELAAKDQATSEMSQGNQHLLDGNAGYYQSPLPLYIQIFLASMTEPLPVPGR
uniref:Inner membrane protein n=1 Tax=Caenorhabditis tropicalis TaxID=1561998 RepID=A0A1I7TID2_9PELO